MNTQLPTILTADNGPDLVAQLNANFALIMADFGLEQTLSAAVTIPDNRSVVTYGSVRVAGTLALNLRGTAALLII